MSWDSRPQVVEYYYEKCVCSWIGSTPATTSQRKTLASQNSIYGVLKSAFLPEGFPESVSEDYIGFQGWDTVQALCSYVRGILSSHAIMKGVGVGQQAATPLAAVFMFVVRDFTGMLGGIIFSFFQGSSFDACAKQWRLFADVLNDIGYTLDLATPFFPQQAFLPLACVSSILRSMTGVAGGATRAALTQHLARSGNAADVAAKEGSQEAATTMVGMALGMAVAHIAAERHVVSWLIFLMLTVLHVLANVRAMRSLLLTGINQPRLELLLRTFAKEEGRVLDVRAMAAAEDLMPPPLRALLQWLRGEPRIVFGAPLSSILGNTASNIQLQQLLDRVAERHYAVEVRGRTVLVLLQRGSDTSVMLQAYCHAVLLVDSLQEGRAQEVEPWIRQKFSVFRSSLEQAGWNLGKISLQAPCWTLDWGTSPVKKLQ